MILTTTEYKYLKSLLQEEIENINMDLSGAVDITPTTARLLNDNCTVMEALLKKVKKEAGEI